jgi:predicted CopG family antitoxin
MESTITIRIDKATKDKLEAAAKKEGRSLSNYLRRLLEKKSSTAS